jgi:eukaryotic-like serine/threonine-protein kinase
MRSLPAGPPRLDLPRRYPLSGSLLTPGERIVLSSSGTSCDVESVLGTGGQGEVYQVRLSSLQSQGTFAFKCYHPSVASKEQWQALSTLVDVGPPTDRFLWPLDLAEINHLQSFGYLMALRDPRFAGLAQLVRRDISTSFRSLTLAAFQLADSFLALHSRGLCYRDISLGNMFFDPTNGDVLICDNDNVAVDGMGHASVLGTTGFMAPEIERLEAVPSTTTDLYSLSVLLFLMFINHHPLIGERERSFASLDQTAFRSLYGTDPVFIYDPDDASNRPVPGVHDNALVLWPLYPRAFQRLFIRAFTTGLRDPVNGRVRESTWKRGAAALRDLILRCGCGAESFYDDELGTIANAVPGECWACQGHPVIPPRLRLATTVVVLNPDTVLYPHHLGGDPYDYSVPLARVSRHPVDPTIQGLENLSTETWRAQGSDGIEHDVGPQRSVRLTDGMRIRFTRADATVNI